MIYHEIKKQIQTDLNQRGLKDPSIRLNALESVEDLLRKEINEMLLNPIRLLEMLEKNQLKQDLSKHKQNGRLNDAESSVINEYYYRINAEK